MSEVKEIEKSEKVGKDESTCLSCARSQEALSNAPESIQSSSCCPVNNRKCQWTLAIDLLPDQQKKGATDPGHLATTQTKQQRTLARRSVMGSSSCALLLAPATLAAPAAAATSWPAPAPSSAYAWARPGMFMRPAWRLACSTSART
eukprot:1157213-Pelagomonas_calceolata.AAC.6